MKPIRIPGLPGTLGGLILARRGLDYVALDGDHTSSRRTRLSSAPASSRRQGEKSPGPEPTDEDGGRSFCSVDNVLKSDQSANRHSFPGLTQPEALVLRPDPRMTCIFL